MLPVYFDFHWMLIIVDLDSMQMYWYDSLPEKVMVNRVWKGARDPKILGEKFMNYVKMFFLERCGVPQSCWTIVYPRTEVQTGVDCALHVILNAREYLGYHSHHPMSPECRENLCLDILRGELT